MSKEKTDIDECPNCENDVVIYKGWATFEEGSIDILSGAKWHCPECEETGKIDSGSMK